MECKCDKSFKSYKALNAHWAFCPNNPNARPRLPEKSIEDIIDARAKRYDFFKDPAYREKQSRIRHEKVANGFIVSEQTREKISNATKLYFSKNREIFSNIMRQTVLDNPASYSANNVVGRVRNIQYGDVIVKGSWELIVAKALDDLSIKWEQPCLGINYVWKDRTHSYFPDFYLSEHDLFIEVKGYERERDRAKWQEVPNLIVVKETSIKEINVNSNALLALINNFTRA